MQFKDYGSVLMVVFLCSILHMQFRDLQHPLATVKLSSILHMQFRELVQKRIDMSSLFHIAYAI